MSVKNNLEFLIKTKDVFLTYRDKEEIFVKGYIDASFQTDLDKFRS